MGMKVSFAMENRFTVRGLCAAVYSGRAMTLVAIKMVTAMKKSMDNLVNTVQSFDRDRCIAQLSSLKRPKIDFTEEFLQQQTLDRLRHIVLAALLQAAKAPIN